MSLRWSLLTIKNRKSYKGFSKNPFLNPRMRLERQQTSPSAHWWKRGWLCRLIWEIPCWFIKAAFHYSSQLQTWFSTRFAARFSTSLCGFATRFRHFLSKTWSRTAAGSLVHARARQMECRKTRYKLVHSWLSTCFRPGIRPGLQLARIMECSLKSAQDARTDKRAATFNALTYRLTL